MVRDVFFNDYFNRLVGKATASLFHWMSNTRNHIIEGKIENMYMEEYLIYAVLLYDNQSIL